MEGTLASSPNVGMCKFTEYSRIEKYMTAEKIDSRLSREDMRAVGAAAPVFEPRRQKQEVSTINYLSWGLKHLEYNQKPVRQYNLWTKPRFLRIERRRSPA